MTIPNVLIDGLKKSRAGEQQRFLIKKRFCFWRERVRRTFPGESSGYPLPPKAKSLFYEKTLLLFPARLFFNPSIETLLVLSFFLDSAKFGKAT